jgi:hypothetical protein
MADLQDDAVARREIDQRRGFGGGGGDRLLDEAVHAALEEEARDGEMRAGRGGDRHRVDPAVERDVARERLGPQGSAHRRGAGRICIGDGDEGHARYGGELLGVEAAEIARADDGDLQGRGHARSGCRGWRGGILAALPRARQP